MPVRKTGVVTRNSRTRTTRKSVSNPRKVSPMRVKNSVAIAIATRRYANFWRRIRESAPPGITLEARRPDDLLLFTLYTKNLKLADDAPPRLVKDKPNLSAIITLELPPQHFAEQAFLDATAPEVKNGPDFVPFKETTDKLNQDDGIDPQNNSLAKNTITNNAEPIGDLPAAKMRMSGPSRLAFLMPTDVFSLDLTFTDVLEAARTWPQALSSLAQPAPKLSIIQQGNHDEWVKDITLSQGWFDNKYAANSVLSKTTSEQTNNAVNAAANLMVSSIVPDAQGRSTLSTNEEIENAIESEISKLTRRYAELADEQVKQIAEVVFAMQLTENIAKLAPAKASEIAVAVNGLKVLLIPHEPPQTVTALELPYRLITSPLPGSYWSHKTALDLSHKRTELWHTRLSTSPIRAIWSPDYKLPDILDVVNANPAIPFRMSLDALDREMLVKLMAGYTERKHGTTSLKPNYLPIPARAERLILSAMGGLLDAEGNWHYLRLPQKVGLEQWRHLAALGRDQYVRVVYRGFLFPFGHSASLIKVTERKFENYKNSLSKRVAVLRQRFFIVVRETCKVYTGNGNAFQGRNFPFSKIQISTRVTPNLIPPETSAVEPVNDDPNNKFFDIVPKRACFWPMVSPINDFEFDLTATDIIGIQHCFSMPLLFVGLEANQEIPDRVLLAYNAAIEARRNTNFNGSSICYAPLPTNVEEDGDTRLPTTTLLFAGGENNSAADEEAQVYPEIESTEIGIRAIQRLLNDPNAVIQAHYADVYKTNGFSTDASGNNFGEVYLEANDAFAMQFSESGSKSDALGGIAGPSLNVAALSRKIGPVGDLATIAKNEFNPLVFFGDARILGGIKLVDLLSTVSDLNQAPKMISKELPGKIESSFNWHTTISKTDPAGIFEHSPKGLTTAFDMQGLTSAPINNPDDITHESIATLTNFKVNLFDFITIWFDRLEFISKTGSKADVIVDLHPKSETEGPVEFGGPLEFVNALSDIIPMDGFSDPPNIEVSPSGLTASYSLAIPSLEVGIFALSNMSIGAGFSLPFNNEPMQVRFNFSERQNPFSLTVSLFGGGGFFAIGIGAQGVNEIEAALEFGAAIAINLGVASGGVEVKAGVYFHWLQESVEFAGYVRLHGELSVMGLISASLTFDLRLAYLKEDGKSIVWGEATLIIEIDLLVFSGSVKIHCRRQFSGSPSDPTFVQLMPTTSDWDQYCDAFAAEEAA